MSIRIKKIEFRMIRQSEKCWIKVVPMLQQSNHARLYINLNGTEHQWDIYDKSGRDKHNIYLKGYNIKPTFYLTSGDDCYRIDFDYNTINVYLINETHKIDQFVRSKYQCISPQTSCWAIAIYSTKIPEKHPFDIM